MTVKHMMLITLLEFRLSPLSVLMKVVLIKPSLSFASFMFSGGCLRFCEHG